MNSKFEKYLGMNFLLLALFLVILTFQVNSLVDSEIFVYNQGRIGLIILVALIAMYIMILFVAVKTLTRLSYIVFELISDSFFMKELEMTESDKYYSRQYYLKQQEMLNSLRSQNYEINRILISSTALITAIIIFKTLVLIRLI